MPVGGGTEDGGGSEIAVVELDGGTVVEVDAVLARVVLGGRGRLRRVVLVVEWRLDVDSVEPELHAPAPTVITSASTQRVRMRTMAPAWPIDRGALGLCSRGQSSWVTVSRPLR